MKVSTNAIFLAFLILSAAVFSGCGDKSDVPIAQPTTTGPGESSNGVRPGTPGGPPATPDAHLEKNGQSSGAPGSRTTNGQPGSR